MINTEYCLQKFDCLVILMNIVNFIEFELI